MPSEYLIGTDLAFYGVPLIQRPTIIRASAMIDTFLRRPFGCVWVEDWAGMPAYMAAANPFRSMTCQANIAPGLSVVVPLPGTTWDDSVLGQTVIMDRLTNGPTEVCWVSAYSPGQIVLSQVMQPHAGPVKLDFGMGIMEQIELPDRRSTVMLAQWPIQRVVSGLGRYGYGRRSNQESGYFDDVNLLAALSTFGGAPIWEAFDILSSSYNSRTGEYWVPSSLLLSYFTEVKIRYIGGWSADGLPSDIKVACATIATAMDAAALGALTRRFDSGKTDIQRFTDSVMDADTRRMLRQYQATVLG
jgi:hypothetical protein